ncbi:Rv0361 family membrane protein [Actinomadura kijaniata]|uniref:Rv0361 family membrane protein n=1 Tax=Actinomadura kijaniata TaxID=46161 RepID=UPI003F1D0DFB
MRPWPQQPPPRHTVPRRNLVLLLSLPVLTVAAAVTVAVAATGRLASSGPGPGGGGEQGEVRKVVTDFAAAVDRNDNATVLSMLCPREAAGVADDLDSPGDRGDPRAELVPITVEHVRITGDVAEARVTRPRQPPATLFLRREGGAWKLCDPERYGR